MRTKIDGLRTELKRICVDSGLDAPDVIDDAFVLDQVDSLGRAELIVQVETDFGVQLTNSEILGMKTFGDLVVILKSRVPEQVGES